MRYLPALFLILMIGMVSTCGCTAEGPGRKAPEAIRAGWREGTPLRQIVPAYMGDGLELAVVPTPKSVVCANRLLLVSSCQLIVPTAYEHASTLRDLAALPLPGLGKPISDGDYRDAPEIKCLVIVGNEARNSLAKAFLTRMGAGLTADEEKVLGREGYRLVISRDATGRVIILLAGSQPAGDFWAVQSLRQLLAEKDGKHYALGVWIKDWPSFRARGSKEMRNYMPQYKDNFSWGKSRRQRQVLLANFGWHVPYYAPGGALDCSAKAIDNYTEALAKDFEAGARAFGIKFDDVGIGMTPETKARFKTYGPAICYFMRELDKRVKTLDPSCHLYYMPQCYGARDGGGLAKQILEAGGLPKDTALCWTGPSVFSRVLAPEAMKHYMDSFGLGANKGLIYDNIARKGDYFPIMREGRSPELVNCLDGVFSENSTRLNRITRCDQNWNPEAYDPQRALKLACREVANRDPGRYKAVYEFVSFYEAHRQVPPKLPRAEKIAWLKKSNSTLEMLLGKLKAVLPEKDAMLKDVSAAVDVKLNKMGKLIAAGYREARAVRAAAAPRLDGKLDDPCWQSAPEISGFVVWDQEKWQSLRPQMGAPIPPAHKTCARIVYDDKNVYLGVRCQSDDAAAFKTTREDGSPQWWAKKKDDHPDTRGIWHGPCIEMFLAPGEDRMNYYHFVAGITGLRYDAYSGQPPAVWNSGWQTQTQVQDKEWVLEAAIPLASLQVDAIHKGDIWGLNFCRNKPGHQMWTFVWGPKGFHTPGDFGTLTFE